MGRIRQKDIKRAAHKIIERYEEELSTDFKQNREFLEKVMKIQGKIMKNKISGYITHKIKQKEVK